MFLRYWHFAWLGLLLAGPLRGLAQVTLPPPVPPAAAAPAPAPADSARDKGLTANTRRLRQLDSLRQLNSSRLGQLQQELAQLKNGRADQPRERELLRQFRALRAADSLRQVRARTYIDSLKQFAQGFPVAPHGDTLFYVFTRLGPFSPQERARLTTEKILSLEKQVFFKPDSLRVFPSEQTADLMYGQLVLQSISENDALWQNTRKDSLAQQHRRLVVRGIAAYQKATSFSAYLREALLTVLVILAFFLTIKYLNKLFNWLRRRFTAREGSWLPSLRLGNYEVFDESRQRKVGLLVLTVLQWTAVALTVFLVLPLGFRIFPGTQGIADMLLDYILVPAKRIVLSLWHYLPDLFTILVIVAVFRYVLKVVHSIKEEVRLGHLTIDGFYADWANPTYQIVRVLIFAFALVVIFPYLPGSNSPVFQGVSVFLGFLFTFGSAGSLSNVVAGLILTYMRAFKIGDRVKIGDVTGDVLEKTLLVTRVRTVKNEEITIPNSTVMSSYTTNYSTAAPTLGLILHTTITIGYDVPWKQVHALMLAAAAGVPDVLTDPAPFILQTSLDDFYVSYQLNAYTRAAGKQAGLYSLLHQGIQDQFKPGRGRDSLAPLPRPARRQPGDEPAFLSTRRLRGPQLPGAEPAAAGGQALSFLSPSRQPHPLAPSPRRRGTSFSIVS